MAKLKLTNQTVNMTDWPAEFKLEGIFACQNAYLSMGAHFGDRRMWRLVGKIFL
jgi:hypothetical protein